MCDLDEFELAEYLRYREAVTGRAGSAAKTGAHAGTPRFGPTGPSSEEATA
ncbi:MAG TPA: hypothetical protein VEE86_01515 [Thermoplasmata archaeon]|nr:hypothetical protein [Thermoplasmata archaeon]